MNEAFYITHAVALSQDDLRVLSLLYSPLTKPDGLALYLFCVSLVDGAKKRSLDYPISYIYDALNMNPERFIEMRKRLEAVKLIETYDDQSLIMAVKPPLSAAAYLQSPLSAYLKTTLPAERIADLKRMLLDPPTKGLKKKNISASFESVFGALSGSFRESEISPFSSNATIDVDQLLEQIPLTWVPNDVRNEAFKEAIKHVSYVYGLEAAQMKEVIKKSISASKTLDFDSLSDHASQMYKPSESKQPLDIDTFKKVHPSDVLKWMTGSHVPSSDLKVVDQLIRESGLKLEVINVLIAYVLTELNGQMPVYKYFEKVSGQWHRNHIQTAEMAVAHIKQMKEKRPKESAKEPSIDWFKAYLKEKEVS